jgi:1,4-alpha-glucan branching enzyme
MAASQGFITPKTPMGANLVGGGATFRAWAPAAQAVYVNGRFRGRDHFARDMDPALLLTKDTRGFWAGFLPGVMEGDRYKFYVVGKGAKGFKRDPCARELTTPEDFPGSLEFPGCDCVVRDPGKYKPRSRGFRPPAFNDFVIYQLHVGTFFGPQRDKGTAKFLDVLEKIDHLVRLGVNAVEPLPVDEAGSDPTIGYDGRDFFSPEMLYGVPVAALEPYLAKVNALFASKGVPGVTRDELAGSMAQLKVMVDLLHLHGIAVIFDVVYNHAGPFFGDDDCIYFFDLLAKPGTSNNNDSQYFTDQEIAGGLSFAYWKEEVRRFLIDNARFFLDEYGVDGFRYDLVSAIENHGGEMFCHDLTNTVRSRRPRNLQIAEYWNTDRRKAVTSPNNGLGFDAAWEDTLRGVLWNTVSAAANGAFAAMDLESLAGALAFRPHDFPHFWKVVQMLEDHDEVQKGRNPRIASRADPSDSRSWFGRSRTRVANGILLTAPGIPMLFMGQEFLENRQWSPNPPVDGDVLIFWDGLEPIKGQKVMQHFYRFMQELLATRRRHPALRGETCNVFVHRSRDRVLAYHRWLEGIGRDVVVVASFNETSFDDPNYQLGFPQPGRWLEVLNSDVYDDLGRRTPFSNGGSIVAGGPPMDGFGWSAGVVIPANSMLVFARDGGDSF